MSNKIPCLLLIVSVLALTSEYSISPCIATDIVILPTTSGYLNADSLFQIVGEVQNVGNVTLTDVNVNATFYNETGEIVAVSGPVEPELYTILPGRKSPFEITLYSPFESEKVSSYYVTIASYSITQNGQIGLQILSNSSFLDSSGFRISGIIGNIGAQNASFTRVITTFYNLNGTAIAQISNYTSPSFLEINQTAQFNVLLNSSQATQVDRYALEAEAYDSLLIQDYELVPEFSSFLFIFAPLTIILAFVLNLKYSSKRRAHP